MWYKGIFDSITFYGYRNLIGVLLSKDLWVWKQVWFLADALSKLQAIVEPDDLLMTIQLQA